MDRLVIEDFESMAPVILTPQRGPMSDEEFAAFCERYPDHMIECTADGEILIMPPTKSETGRQNAHIIVSLGIWARQDGRGRIYDSSSGFRLPNMARRSPDASWISKARIAALPVEEREGFYGICPDFVIELRSSSDRLAKLKAKMVEYIATGAQLGWLIDPQRRNVWIYRPGREPECIENPDRVEGEGPIAGFTLEMAEIWE